MTSVRDFESRDRSNTGASQAVPLSPVARNSTTRDYRGSVSRHSRPSSVAGSIRFRHPTRSNTVTTYREPERSDPVWQPGAEPGLDTSLDEDQIPAEVKALKADCDISIIDFSDFDVQHVQTDNAGLAKVLEQPRQEDYPCRWICVNGLSWDVIQYLGNKYSLHRLSIEDIVHTHTRTKVDWYATHACIVLTLQKLVMLHQHDGSDDRCDCPDARYHAARTASGRKEWYRKPRKRHATDLPYYLDKDGDGKVDEFVSAYAGTSRDAPIRSVRTLYRYESAQVPEHTEFMERHSTLASEDLAVSVEQVGIFLLADNTVISFFEQSAEDVLTPLRIRLDSKETILRRSCDASLLVQAIIDAIVDLAVPVKDAYNKARKELQIDAMLFPNIKTSRSLHIFGEEIDMLQNLFKPIVHLVNALRDHNSEPLLPPVSRMPSTDGHQMSLKPDKTRRDREGEAIFARKDSDFRMRPKTLKRTETATTVTITPLAHTYLGDVLDHSISMIQSLEQMDASAANISNLIFNTVSARTNNFMMILAIVTVFFAPITFVSGYFGMNFAGGAGLNHPFKFFWIVAIPSLVFFGVVVFATMFWNNIKDFLAKRGISAKRLKRAQALRAHEGAR